MDPTQIQTPTSPLGNFPELAAMYQSSFQAPAAEGQIGASVYNSKVDLANQQAAQEAEQKRQQALADPSNYRAVPKDDGGYGFYDPTGKEISAHDYAIVTGKSVPDVLKNSQNPIDIGFQKDFKDLQDYINLKLQSKSDTAAAQKAQAIEQDVLKNSKINIAQLKPDELIQAFKQAYPTIYGQGGFQGAGTAGIPTGQTFIPQATNSFVDNYQFGGSGGGVR